MCAQTFYCTKVSSSVCQCEIVCGIIQEEVWYVLHQCKKSKKKKIPSVEVHKLTLLPVSASLPLLLLSLTLFTFYRLPFPLN